MAKRPNKEQQAGRVALRPMSSLATENIRRAQRGRREKEATMRGFPEEKIAGMLTAIAVISQAKPKPGDHGSMPCPVCGGSMVWEWGGPRAIRAWCATADCLVFMS